MKLQAKLGSAYAILIFAMLGTSTVAYLRMSEVNRTTTLYVSERVPIVRQAERARIDLQKSSRVLEQLLLFGGDPAEAAYLRARHRDQWAFAETAMATMSDLAVQYSLDDEGVRIREIDAQMARLNDLEAHIDALIASGKPEDTASALSLAHNQMAGQEKVVWDDLEFLIAYENVAMESEATQVHNATHSMIWTLWITTLVSSCLGGLIASAISRRISLGVRGVAERAAAIAQGDLTGPPLAIVSKDEVGMLANATELMQANLRLIIGAVARTAASVTRDALSLGETGKDMQRKMDEQNQRTEMIAGAVQEMSATVAEVSRHSGNAARTARDAAETARKGGGIVHEMLAAMNSIAEAVRSTSSTIHLLGEDSTRIGHIVDVIDEIARKTNLLALNAAIEAARAGEQGRGFAVVAGEVRRLAESTAQATNEISQMVRGIQERTRNAVVSMAEGTKSVGVGTVTIGRAGEALETIIGMAEQVDKMIAHIAVASVQQTSTAEDSSSALHSIYRLGSENLNTMSASVLTAESLRTSALELEQQIERFQIGGDPDDGETALRSEQCQSGSGSAFAIPMLGLRAEPATRPRPSLTSA
jgi:methyl-accepting chemotaxis protein